MCTCVRACVCVCAKVLPMVPKWVWSRWDLRCPHNHPGHGTAPHLWGASPPEGGLPELALSSAQAPQCFTELV